MKLRLDGTERKVDFGAYCSSMKYIIPNRKCLAISCLVLIRLILLNCAPVLMSALFSIFL